MNREGIINMFFETSQKWEKLNKRLEEYDKLFGEQERKEYDVKSNTHSLWNILLNQPIYINPNYNPLTIEEYFIPSTQNIVLWKTYYIPPKYPNDSSQ